MSENNKLKKIGFDYDNYNNNKLTLWDPFEEEVHPWYTSQYNNILEAKEDVISPKISWWIERTLIQEIDNKIKSHLLKNHKFTNYNRELIKDYMIRDIYKMFYNNPLKMDTPKDKYWWCKILHMMDNYLLKIATNNREFNSYIACENICKELLDLFIKKEEEDNNKGVLKDDWKNDLNNYLENQIKDSNKDNQNQPEQSQQVPDSQVEENKENQENNNPNNHIDANNNQKQEQKEEIFSQTEIKQLEAEKTLKEIKKTIEQAIEKSIQEISESTEKFSGYGLEDSIDNVSKFHDLQKLFRYITISNKQLSSFVNQSINKFSGALGSKSHKIEENFLDAEDISDIFGTENLFFDGLIEELTVEDTKNFMRFDIYIDKSGSMSDNINYGENQTAQRLALCKVLALKMQNLNILNNIYCFDSKIKKIEAKELISLREYGGTDITKVIENINITKKPSVILTDGEGYILSYSKNAYIICIEELCENSKFLNKLIEKKQIVLYRNGKFEKYKSNKY